MAPRSNVQKANEAGWETIKGAIVKNKYFAVKRGGTDHNCITRLVPSENEAALAALDMEYKFHREKKYHVWMETDDPAKSGKQGGNFVKTSPPLTQETAESVANLYKMEHPDQDFVVSIGKPSSYFL
jgi:hypothetical protein